MRTYRSLNSNRETIAMDALETGFTIKQIATEMGLSLATIYYWRAGKNVHRKQVKKWDKK